MSGAAAAGREQPPEAPDVVTIVTDAQLAALAATVAEAEGRIRA